MRPRETICQYRLGPILIKFDQSEARLRVFVVGCTWKRLPGSRILYGDDLLASGALLLPKPCAAFKSSVLRCWKPRRQLFINSFIHFMSIMYQDKLRTAEQSIQRLKLDLLSETNARTELAAGWLLGWLVLRRPPPGLAAGYRLDVVLRLEHEREGLGARERRLFLSN